MRKLIVHCTMSSVGSENYEAFVMENDATKAQIEEVAWQIAVENAEMYGYYPPCYAEEDGIEEDEIDEGIDGFWEDYVPEKHDMHCSGASSFEEEFNRLTAFAESFAK